MASRFTQKRQQLLALVAIILLALMLLLVVGLRAGLFRLGHTASSQSSTGGSSGVSSSFSSGAIADEGVPDAVDTSSGYQAIYGGQVTAGQTTGGQTGGGTGTGTGGSASVGVLPTNQQPGSGTTNTAAGGQNGGSQGGQTLGGGGTREGIATPELPSALLFVLGLISVAGVAWLFARRRNALGHS